MGRMKLLLILLGALSCMAQPFDARYTIIKTTSLSGAVEKLTVQQPASGAKRVRFTYASVYCSAACTVTMSRDGTAATGTSLPPVALSGHYAASVATGWHTSDAGAGTTLSPAYAIASGATQTFDLSGIELAGNGTTTNFSIATNSVTATVRIQIVWREE